MLGNENSIAKIRKGENAKWELRSGGEIREVVDHFVDVNKMVTIHNSRQHGLSSEQSISREHVTNNEAVRKTLLQRGIRPESLPAAEDVKKVQRRLEPAEKKSLKNIDGLGS